LLSGEKGIGSASIADFYEPNGQLKAIHTLPDRLAEVIREVEFGEDDQPKRIRLHEHDAAFARRDRIAQVGAVPCRSMILLKDTKICYHNTII